MKYLDKEKQCTLSKSDSNFCGKHHSYKPQFATGQGEAVKNTTYGRLGLGKKYLCGLFCRTTVVSY